MRTFLAIVLLGSQLALAAPINKSSQTKQNCAKIAAAMSAGNIDRAAEILEEHSAFEPSYLADLKYNIHKGFSKVPDPQRGDSRGVHHVNVKKAGNLFIAHYLVIQYEKGPVGVNCTYYNNGEYWEIHGFWMTDSDFLHWYPK